MPVLLMGRVWLDDCVVCAAGGGQWWEAGQPSCACGRRRPMDARLSSPTVFSSTVMSSACLLCPALPTGRMCSASTAPASTVAAPPRWASAPPASPLTPRPMPSCASAAATRTLPSTPKRPWPWLQAPAAAAAVAAAAGSAAVRSAYSRGGTSRSISCSNPIAPLYFRQRTGATLLCASTTQQNLRHPIFASGCL